MQYVQELLMSGYKESCQGLQCFIDVLLGFKLAVVDQLDYAVLANDICLPALKKAKEILLHSIFLAHLLAESLL